MRHDPVAAAQRKIRRLRTNGDLKRGRPRKVRPEPPTPAHVCNRGGRLNGWPVCWFCYVDAVLGEMREREESDLVDMDDVLNGRHG